MNHKNNHKINSNRSKKTPNPSDITVDRNQSQFYILLQSHVQAWMTIWPKASDGTNFKRLWKI